MKPGKVDGKKAVEQHQRLKNALAQAGARTVEVPFVHGAYDSVFIKDNALLHSERGQLKALLTNPSFEERRVEQLDRKLVLSRYGFEVRAHGGSFLEGGDVIPLPRRERVLMGYGFRTQPQASRSLEKFFRKKVTKLELKDPRFYHLDTALSVIETGHGLIAFAHREAFTASSWKKLSRLPEIRDIVEVSEAEAMRFGLNLVQVHDKVILGGEAPDIQKKLVSLGQTPIVCPLGEFQLGGGSAACLTAAVHEDYCARKTGPSGTRLAWSRAAIRRNHDFLFPKNRERTQLQEGV